ncbi:glutamate-cysteine ligase family protein [Corynebacterium timonense]|uniref:Gamma-glutamyl:cysteine ligase YbdK, ATP-grasp superfamily n=1 Tax=Corynebacterium timonense TaxID=441500 RepID=A0A1H1R7H7_9CORY|nr:glutamate-cysteine ligase family protein [Corynebacterium timonense]SDS31744.1 Gamma-glutamyl:cysteine ligase YbdK, ATP-grasp superfamily [Corynebacterium timonense]
MGDSISTDTYTPRQRSVYRKRLEDELEVFDRHLQRAEFINKGTIGLELELNLVDDEMRPAPRNQEVLERLDEDYQSEIGSYNVELNLPPLNPAGDGLAQLEDNLSARLRAVKQAAEDVGVHMAMIGTLPTLTPEFLEDPAWMTNEFRYKGLSNAVMESRGELVRIGLDRVETFEHDFEDIATESACTSMQLHLQVAPDRFAAAWNASQAIAGVQAALSANSPLFVGRRLWHESRIPVFRQSIDTRTKELINQGVRPRVWFGERWITSVFDLFEENVRYFSPLIPEGRVEAGSPIMTGDSPGLHYLNLHNGTVWRWNRPIYDPNGELSHIRVENRLLPAGPTVKDIIADAAFYYGMVKYLGTQNRPVWSRLSFEQAGENFEAGARDGLGARMSWPTLGSIGVAELVVEHLAPQAREGLASLNINQDSIDEYIGIIESRARRHQNGASWQLAALTEAGPGTKPGAPERAEALVRVLRQYLRNQEGGAPVHTWSLEVE